MSRCEAHVGLANHLELGRRFRIVLEKKETNHRNTRHKNRHKKKEKSERASGKKRKGNEEEVGTVLQFFRTKLTLGWIPRGTSRQQEQELLAPVLRGAATSLRTPFSEKSGKHAATPRVTALEGIVLFIRKEDRHLKELVLCGIGCPTLGGGVLDTTIPTGPQTRNNTSSEKGRMLKKLDAGASRLRRPGSSHMNSYRHLIP